MTELAKQYPRTPDGRYFVIRGRLWRTSNPAWDEAQRERLVHALMAARLIVRDAGKEPTELPLPAQPWTPSRWRSVNPA